MAKRRREIAVGVLGLVVVAGLILRFYDLDGESLWLDEGRSVTVANLELGALLQDVYHMGTVPPLHYVLLHFWIKVFGDSEFSVRALSAACGVVSIVVIYLVGVAVGGRQVGMLAAVLLSLSSFHVYFAQEARAYALFGMFSLLSMYFLLKVEQEYSVKHALGYMSTTALVLYAHPHGLFVIMTQNVYVLTGLVFSAGSSSLTWRCWAVMQGCAWLAFSPWLVALVMKVFYIQTHRLWLPKPSALTLLYSVYEFCGSNGIIGWLFLAVGALALVTVTREMGSVSGRRFFESAGELRWGVSIRDPRSAYFLCAWLLGPMLIPFVISKVSAPIYFTRYSIVASFALYLLVAKGVEQIKKKYMLVIILAIIIFWYPVQTFRYYKQVNKEQWRSVARLVKERAEASDIVVVSEGYCLKNVLEYYMRGSQIRRIGFSGTADEERLAGLLESTKDHDRVWLVLSHVKGDDGQRIIGKLREAYRWVGRQRYRKIDVLVFER